MMYFRPNCEILGCFQRLFSFYLVEPFEVPNIIAGRTKMQNEGTLGTCRVQNTAFKMEFATDVCIERFSSWLILDEMGRKEQEEKKRNAAAKPCQSKG